MKNNSTNVAIKSPQRIPQSKLETSLTSSFQELYLKKDYKGAVSYLLQNKQHLSSGIFHYNLGTVYAKMSDFPAARFHMEKALKEGYVNSSSLNNLSYIKSQLQVDDLSSSSSMPDQIMNSALAIPSSLYMSFSLILLIAGLIMAKSGLIKRKLSQGIGVIIILFPLCFSLFYVNKINHAIAFKEAILYEGPSKIFSEKGKISAGSKIILGEFKEGWFYVKFPISLAGWVSKDQLGLY